MEAFTKLRKVVPCGVRLLSARYSSNSHKEGKPAEETTPVEEPVLPFSREGDCGYSLVNDVQLPKDDRIFHAIGNTDELLCHLGVARENAIKNKHPYTDKLTRIQTMLVDIVLAISKQSTKEAFPAKNTKELEEWIIKYSKDLTPAEKYLLPGGGKVATSLHVARAVCRRAERTVSPLINEGYLDREIQVYFNRLADLLFTWARYAAKRDERSESVYTPKSESKKKPVEAKPEPSS
ncbi:corrinoid adenosyltransferase-like isoform X1 [Homalodisca vitripennis]|uniref:corrinoid adenosyltransferase-like isoform X1 n=1 Tax=Homalodisca vitripennis TaxID=197043 RepID=UPI001EE9D2CB|nr:corrinoid adenosyltransferase-like isoform X1 [Homalodisca vitripennis]